MVRSWLGVCQAGVGQAGVGQAGVGQAGVGQARVFALPKTAGSAQTHKSMSFI